MQLSVCIITKNEKENLEKCLAALHPYGFELVVVDTGSSDGSKEMAARYTSSIYDFVWCDDFGAAKNYAVSKAENDMVMVIDSDEFICPFDNQQFLQDVAKHPHQVGRIRRVNYFSRNGERCENREWINRIFNRLEYCYEGRIHEQICSTQGKDEYQTYQTNVVIDHSGYDGTVETRRKKAKRNIELLLQEFETNPDDTYILYQLGKGYYMAEDYPQAVRYFELALGYDLNPGLEYVIDMVETYGYALLNCGQAETALLLESVYEEFKSNADFQFLMGLVYMNNEHYDQAVDEFLKATTHEESRTTGVNSYLAYYNAGVIRECLGDTMQAKVFYKKCGSYEKARKQLAGLD